MSSHYKVYLEGIDYKVMELEQSLAVRGKRTKRLVRLSTGEPALLKIRDRTNKSEDCSEKIASELARIIGFPCARVEIAQTLDATPAALSVLFTDVDRGITLIEASDFLLIKNRNDYNLQTIISKLGEIGDDVVVGFVRQMIFDALIGEQDRHEQNWGLILAEGGVSFAPFYDSADSLLSEFLNSDDRLLRYDRDGSSPSFEAYINRSKIVLYNTDNNKQFKSFEAIKYLKEMMPDIVKKESKALEKLSNENVTEVVERIPSRLLTDTHKHFIIKYILRRKEIILGIANG